MKTKFLASFEKAEYWTTPGQLAPLTGALHPFLLGNLPPCDLYLPREPLFWHMGALDFEVLSSEGGF